jgi:hypothetical protein
MLHTPQRKSRTFWAAHSAKCAWAVQGANFKCKSGDLVWILGDEGSEKTHLLTAIVELLLEPLKTALSTTLVRGKVHVVGVELSEWDGFNDGVYVISMTYFLPSGRYLQGDRGAMGC